MHVGEVQLPRVLSISKSAGQGDCNSSNIEAFKIVKLIIEYLAIQIVNSKFILLQFIK